MKSEFIFYWPSLIAFEMNMTYKLWGGGGERGVQEDSSLIEFILNILTRIVMLVHLML